LQSYYQAFFAEEEKRIASALRNGLAHAQELAGRLPLADLLVELTQGVHFKEPFKESNLVLVPGYWNTPFVIFPKIGQDTMLMLFGVRPLDMSLVPGEQVPDTLLLVLKAMADPTRLKIMRYLNEESLTPTEIARRLRLRAPTVTHHLSALRLAGLVHLSLDAGDEKRYTARLEAIQAACAHLIDFLTQESQEN
jgi:DNA-binding transcriptional ArsR family regulator